MERQLITTTTGDICKMWDHLKRVSLGREANKMMMMKKKQLQRKKF
jgi:hypothetical protein